MLSMQVILSGHKDTAAAIAQVHQLPVKADIRLREYAFGVWEGLTRSEIKIKYPELYYGRRQNIDIQIPGVKPGLKCR